MRFDAQCPRTLAAPNAREYGAHVALRPMTPPLHDEVGARRLLDRAWRRAGTADHPRAFDLRRQERACEQPS
jgi:hypothetical protein